MLLSGWASLATAETRNWHTGVVLDSQTVRRYVGSHVSGSETGTLTTSDYGYGVSGTYHGESTGTSSAIYRVDELYYIKCDGYVYVASQRLRWRWSKPARLVVNKEVQVAIVKDTMYLLDEAGQEYKTSILKRVALPGNNSDPPPSSAVQRLSDREGAQLPFAIASLAPITSDPPGCSIEINGIFHGSTPSTISLYPGTYAVVIRKEGFDVWSRNVKINGGPSVSVFAELKREQQP